MPGPSSGGKSKSGSKNKKANTPQVGSDSDVRLVADGSDVTFSVPKETAPAKPADSDVKISPDPLKPRTGVHPPSSAGKRASQLALGSGMKPKSKLEPSSASKQASPRPGSGPQPMDSGVRLVPLDDDSDVKLLGASDDVPLGALGEAAATDSNVRLEKVELPPADSGEGGMMLTEEINLDEEILKQQEKEKDQPSTKLKAKSQLRFPSNSPFELSDSDLQMPEELSEGGPKTPVAKKSTPEDSSDFDLAAQQKEAGSSDFDLVPSEDGSILLEGESNDFSLEVADDSEQAVHDDGGNTELTSASSGLTLNKPADEGISLEEGEGQDSSDFDLSLEPEDTPRPQPSRPVEDSDSEFELQAHKTPKPSKKKKPVEEPSDSSEFELSLDSDADAPAVSGEQSDDSNFEINLEGGGEGEGVDEDSSEFELTLDDSGNLAAADDEAAAPQVKARKKKGADAGAGDEQDIFDTDFEVPALDESDDATVADSELESSDFDLALDDSDLAAEDESGSQVVALDEEDSETVADDDGVVDDVDVEEESSDFADLDEDVQVEDVDAEDVEVETAGKVTVKRETVIKEKLIPPAPWGILPVIFMLPCVIVMFLVGVLGFEVVQSSSGLKPPGPLTLAIADLLDKPVTLKK